MKRSSDGRGSGGGSGFSVKKKCLKSSTQNIFRWVGWKGRCKEGKRGKKQEQEEKGAQLEISTGDQILDITSGDQILEIS